MADERLVPFTVFGKFKLLRRLIDISAAGFKQLGIAAALFKFGYLLGLDRALDRRSAAGAHDDAVKLTGVDEIINTAGLGSLGAGGIVIAHGNELCTGMMLMHIVAEALLF